MSLDATEDAIVGALKQSLVISSFHVELSAFFVSHLWPVNIYILFIAFPSISHSQGKKGVEEIRKIRKTIVDYSRHPS